MKKPSRVSGKEKASEHEQDAGLADAAALEDLSAKYSGRWEKLVSTTNWEKGRIICEWRQELLAAGAPLEACSDEAWSRRVGQVSPQHVGRLRRVYQRFGEIYPQFPGLYWSHFQAALDWHDAEMWLEGAVQSGWSVARMRVKRWRAMGAPAGLEPRDADIIAAELDEDVDPGNDSPAEDLGGSLHEVREPAADRRTDAGPAEAEEWEAAGEAAAADVSAAPEPIRPFENLPPLPGDLADAFEAFKLAILNHKLAGWREASLEDVLAVLDALKQLALAPA
jgi:hypothetical protein